jgi:hypothetical protein
MFFGYRHAVHEHPQTEIAILTRLIRDETRAHNTKNV